MTDINHASAIERTIILTLRELAVRAFVANPLTYDVLVVRFLRASQRYV